jgi:hypothetical protein
VKLVSFNKVYDVIAFSSHKGHISFFEGDLNKFRDSNKKITANTNELFIENRFDNISSTSYTDCEDYFGVTELSTLHIYHIINIKKGNMFHENVATVNIKYPNFVFSKNRSNLINYDYGAIKIYAIECYCGKLKFVEKENYNNERISQYSNYTPFEHISSEISTLGNYLMILVSYDTKSRLLIYS